MQVTRRLPIRLRACADARRNVDEPARLTALTAAVRAVADLARPVEPVLLNLADPGPVLVEMTGVLPSHAHPQAHLRIMMR